MGACRDLVVIVTNDVSDEAQHTLSLDGWRVKRVEAVHNPGTWSQSGGGTGFPQKFWAVYTKLQIFNLVEYKKVVFLDADTIVLKNSDVLFQCPGFCAVLRHSERLNSGVMVVTPSKALFQDMTSKITQLPSYTGYVCPMPC
jgi:inositol phosphorylceramide glucuronosyltransferase 1